MEQSELNKRFTHHPPQGDQAERYEKMRAAFRRLADVINELCPEGREKAVAFTELETSQFWANAAIARNYMTQQPDPPPSKQEGAVTTE